uniref:Uncharacterized protein n=1 Tax=Anguilla anguilla TaxID=7936 RepID=A0A0E9RY44_ANGAN
MLSIHNASNRAHCVVHKSFTGLNLRFLFIALMLL